MHHGNGTQRMFEEDSSVAELRWIARRVGGGRFDARKFLTCTGSDVVRNGRSCLFSGTLFFTLLA